MFGGTVNKMKKKAGEKMLAGDFSMRGAFVKEDEAENFGTPEVIIKVSNAILLKRAKNYLKSL